MIVADGDLLILLQGAALNAADGDPAHKLVVVNGADQHLERLIHIRLRGRDVFQNRLKQGLEVGAGNIGRIGGGTLTAGAEQHGGVQLFRGGVQIHQQLQHLINDLVDPLVGTVDLVDDHNDPMAQLQSAAQHEAGLGHGAFCCVHQQNDAVDHFQNTLHLAAEVGVARRVHHIDFHILISDSGVFGQNGDAALPLQIAGVHHAVNHFLIFPVDAALLEHLVHQRGFAMVNVGNNCYVSQMFVLHNMNVLSLYKGFLHSLIL